LPGSAAVEAEEVILGFSRDDLIALARQDVQRRLRADDLARGRDERWIAHILPYSRDFIEHFLHAVERILFRELCCEIREHAAWDLGGQNLCINAGEIAFELTIPAADGPEVIGNRQQRVKCQSRVVGCAVQRGNHGFGRRM